MKYNKSMTEEQIAEQLTRIQNDYGVSESEARDMFIFMEMDI